LIILDTNVISEIMKPPSQRSILVYDWLAAQDGESLFTTAFTYAEIWFGFDLLPAGKRKEALQAEAVKVFDVGLKGRILEYDKASARIYARIAAARVRRGRHIPGTDAMIACIASSRGMAVATRNLYDFTDWGVKLINPWEHGP
jgi:toxin FitB